MRCSLDEVLLSSQKGPGLPGHTAGTHGSCFNCPLPNPKELLLGCAHNMTPGLDCESQLLAYAPNIKCQS